MLSDSQELDEEEEELIDGEAVTSLAVVEGGGGAGRMRLSRHRPVQATPSLPVPRDAETDQEGRPSEELALPMPDTEERPGRRSKRSGGGLFKVLMFGLILVGAAWYGGRYYRQWFGESDSATETGAGAGEGANETKPAAEPPRAVPAKTEPTTGKSHAAAAGHADAGAAAGGGAAERAEPARAERTPPTRESGNKRTRKETARKETARKAPGPDLKSMMAPDPSQLPEAPSRPAPSEPAPPPAPEEP